MYTVKTANADEDIGTDIHTSFAELLQSRIVDINVSSTAKLCIVPTKGRRTAIFLEQPGNEIVPAIVEWSNETFIKKKKAEKLAKEGALVRSIAAFF